MRIVNFHGIGTPERPLEAGEARYWLDENRFNDILDLIAGEYVGEPIRITFDDGNRSDYQIALPALLDRGLEARFFVLTGRIGTAGSLGMSQIRALVTAGMTVGSHGVDHVDWTQLGATDLASELQRSKFVLEDVLGREVASVAIPFGRYNGAVLRAIRAAGYREAYSSDGGAADDDDFPMARTSLTHAMSDDDVADLLEGRMPIWRMARTEVARLVKRLV